MSILIKIIDFIIEIDWFGSPVIVLISFLGSVAQFISGLILGNKDRRMSGLKHLVMTLIYFIIAWLVLLLGFTFLGVFLL